MNVQPLLASAALLGAGLLTAPAASAACDISDTKCAVNGGKCNIKFRNKTGDSGGSDGSSGLNQTSSAQTVLVKAIDENGNRLGNKLQIIAGATMSCEHIKAVLNGNGVCKVFHGVLSGTATHFSIGYQCDGGNVGGPKK